MAYNPTLYGFDGSTFVRTARMVLADKGIPDDQVSVNVLEDAPRDLVARRSMRPPISPRARRPSP